MKRLVKPNMSVAQFSDEIVQAFCEHGKDCSSNCKGHCKPHKFTNATCDDYCESVKGIGIDDDILF